MSDPERCGAIRELLNNIDANECIDVLDEFFECWLSHEQTDGYGGADRLVRLSYYKHIRQFIKQISH